MWNAAFAEYGIDAIYLPFDVEKASLKRFTEILRATESFLGINVTVPHKLAVIDFLDELDPGAARIGSVNTVCRSHDGRLIGCNTDGAGFVASILKPQPGQAKSFVDSLSGADVLLLGAGGSARAVAFHLVPLLNGGRLIICNRTLGNARALADEIGKTGGHVQATGESELGDWAPKVALIINSTTKGQGGVSVLEPYSALAPVKTAPPLTTQPEPSTGAGVQANDSDIRHNNAASLTLASQIPESVRFYDLIYYPEETVFLRHGRETGHRIMNGKAMIVCQAAIAFSNYVCSDQLQLRGLDPSQCLDRVTAIMHNAW